MSVPVKAVQQNGDMVTWQLDISNPSDNVCKDVRVVFTIPTGVSLTGPAEGGFPEIKVSKGSYDATTKTWWIGELAAGQTTTTVFEFTVDDISQADPITGYFELSADMTSLCVEDSSDNKAELIIKVGQACDDDDLSIGSGEDVDTNISIG